MSNRGGTLAELVEGRFPGAIVTGEEGLAGDASTRRYVRLRLDGPGAPATAIAMILPVPTPAEAPELPFANVARYLASRGIAVPAVYAVRDRDLGALLLDDAGEAPLADVLASPATTEAEAERRLTQVARLLADLTASGGSRDCVAFDRSHDETLIRRELDVVLTHGLAAADDGPPRGRGDDPEAAAALDELGATIALQPRRLMHRDFHAWNLHVDTRGDLRVIDFQDAMLGPPMYDVASFCTDRDSDRFITPARESFLLGALHAALADAGVDLYTDRTMLERDYFACVVFRTLRVIGRFRWLAIEDGVKRYLPYIPRMAHQTKRALEALDASPLAHILADRSPHFA